MILQNVSYTLIYLCQLIYARTGRIRLSGHTFSPCINGQKTDFELKVESRLPYINRRLSQGFYLKNDSLLDIESHPKLSHFPRYWRDNFKSLSDLYMDSNSNSNSNSNLQGAFINIKASFNDIWHTAIEITNLARKQSHSGADYLQIISKFYCDWFEFKRDVRDISKFALIAHGLEAISLNDEAIDALEVKIINLFSFRDKFWEKESNESTLSPEFIHSPKGLTQKSPKKLMKIKGRRASMIAEATTKEKDNDEQHIILTNPDILAGYSYKLEDFQNEGLEEPKKPKSPKKQPILSHRVVPSLTLDEQLGKYLMGMEDGRITGPVFRIANKRG